MRKNRVILQSERLIIRMPDKNDVGAIVAYLIRNKDFLAPFSPIRKPEYFTEAYWNSKVKELTHNYENDKSIYLVIMKKDQPHQVIGYTNISDIVRGCFQAAHLGFMLSKSEQGKGYMTEALQTAIDHAFSEMNLHRIMANYLVNNDSSATLLKNWVSLWKELPRNISW